MIPYRPNILSDLPPALAKRLKIIEAIARHTAQDHRAAAANARSGPTIRETYPELAALWQWLILKYSPDQPRVPAGNRDGGQWTRGEGGDGASTASTHPSDSLIRPVANRPVQTAALETGTMTDASAASTQDAAQPRVQYAGNVEAEGDEQFPVQKYGKGHHWISRGVYDDYNLKPETRRVFETSTSGPLADPSVNSWSQEHIEYNQAVKEHFDEFLKRNKITAEQMTPDQARELVDEVRRSSDLRIRNFRMKIERESLRYFRRYGPRGGGRGGGGGDEE